MQDGVGGDPGHLTVQLRCLLGVAARGWARDWLQITSHHCWPVPAAKSRSGLLPSLGAWPGPAGDPIFLGVMSPSGFHPCQLPFATDRVAEG